MSDFFDPDEWERKPAPVTTAGTKFFELKPVGEAPKIVIEAPKQVPVVAPAPTPAPPPTPTPAAFPTFEAPAGISVAVSDLGFGSDEQLTRKQIREREKLTGSDTVYEIVDTTPSFEFRLPYDGDLVDQVPELANTREIDVVEQTTELGFNASPGMILEPTTNSIVLDQIQDLSNYTATVNQTGEILTTGSIQIPILFTDTATGEIAVIQEGEALDAAIQADSSSGFVNSMAPMRVTGVVDSMSRSKVISTNLKRGKTQPYLVLATAVLIVLAGAGVVAAFMLKLL